MFQCDFSSARPSLPGKKHSGKSAYPVGTEGYVAPEIVQQQGYDHMADWFSLGALLYHLLAGRYKTQVCQVSNYPAHHT